MAKKEADSRKKTGTPIIPLEDRIIKSEYSELMQKSYIDYAMSVIVARALPDIRDGLKPVQRRTLYSMSELGLRSDRPHRKSARIVGDTMGKYHPHGDSSIYDALVVMAQDFKKEVPLVDGHGNFGNIEGDGAAAMRYTEARLEKITEEAFLSDLDKGVVDFVPNFDETEKEPSVLPVRIPNFLINGSEGIAVGMATATPPHNLAEAIDAQIAYMKDPEISLDQLMRYLKGPDFPTGGIVINQDDLKEIYETGQGRVRIRGRVEVEKGRAGHINLVITEIPYTMVGSGIGKFLSDVAALAENKLTGDIIDITNQSSKEGIRIVIELKKDADVENFKALLYKKTRLEDTFGVNMLAIVDGRPETLGLKQILKCGADFQYEIATRKYTALLEREMKKKEIQEGLIKAVDLIDLIIEILRGSRDRAMAKRCLVEGDVTGIRFRSPESSIMAGQLRFTEAQANAILDMRLYRLIGLELEALIKEHEETLANIYRYEDILERRSSMTEVIKGELLSWKKTFGRKRRTEITNAEEAVYVVKKEETVRKVVCLIDHSGYAKVMDASAAGRNKEAIEEAYRFRIPARSDGRIALFTREGQMHILKVQDLPSGRLRDKGVPIDNLSGFDSSSEHLLYACCLEAVAGRKLLFVTKGAMIKLVEGSEFDTIRKTIQATKVGEGDSLLHIGLYEDTKTIVLQSEKGMFLKFEASSIPVQKKTAMGARGMKLAEGDCLEAVHLPADTDTAPVHTHGKEVDIFRMKMNKRGEKGTKKL